jgi:tetratricopeptide (TPR) repeat protein
VSGGEFVGGRGRVWPAAVFERATVLADLRRWEQAAELLRAALAVHPDEADLWGQLASVLLGAGRPAEALLAAERQVHLAPQEEWGDRLTSCASGALGRRWEAVGTGPGR